jgi:hypothetical protein
MMSFSYIEEDFRFTTGLQVKMYSETEQLEKPNLPGYYWTQLIDQMDGHWLKTPPNNCLFYVHAPIGTAYWLVKHWEQETHKPEFLLKLDRVEGDNRTWQYLLQQPNVSLKEPTTDELNTVSCVILATQPVTRNQLLEGKSAIVYDPDYTLRAEQGGEYFMNSTIWVTRHGN